MRKDKIFYKSFLEGFSGKIDARKTSYKSSNRYMDNAITYLEKIFQKMSENNETKEKLLYKK